MIRLQVLNLVFGRTEPEPDGWTDRRGSRNSFLDDYKDPELKLAMKNYILFQSDRNILERNCEVKCLQHKFILIILN